jgi:D-inositol-3-phosphate glycosyltransferase
MPELRVASVSFHTSPGDAPGAEDAGGMNVYVDRLARALAARETRVDVFTRSAATPACTHPVPGVRFVALPSRHAGVAAKDELITHVPAFSRAILDWAAARAARYDIIHSHYWLSGLAAVALARRWRVPLVHTHHTIGELKNRLLPPTVAPEPDERLRLERAVIEQCDLVTASTEDERQWVGGDRARIIPPGVDHDRFNPGDRACAREVLGLPPAPMFLIAGRIQPLKGIDLAIRGIAAGRTDGILLIAGGPSGPDGDAELSRLRRLAQAAGVADRVRFIGPQPQSRLVTLYRAADALIVCSHSESFGLTALEAHACGTAVIGTCVGALPNIVRHGRSGFLLTRRDPDELAYRMRDVARDPTRFRDAALRSAARFSWNATAGQLLQEYRRLAAPIAA